MGALVLPNSNGPNKLTTSFIHMKVRRRKDFYKDVNMKVLIIRVLVLSHDHVTQNVMASILQKTNLVYPLA